MSALRAAAGLACPRRASPIVSGHPRAESTSLSSRPRTKLASRSSLSLSIVAAAASTTTTSSSSSSKPPLPPPPPPPAAPPADFDLRAEIVPETREIVADRWPELLDLVDDGTLLALPRPSGYVERRTDGYSEPRLVLLVAAAHVSRASASAARRVVEAVRPSAVVLELCGSRKSVLAEEEDEEEVASSASSSSANQRKASNPFALSGSIARSASLGGAPAMALRLLLARQSDAVLEAALESESESESDGGGEASSSSSSSSSLSSSFSRRPGVEARAAAAAARQVGATIVLGDRPIEITLRRAWEGLSWAERLKLGRVLLLGEGASGSGSGSGGDLSSAAALSSSSSLSPSSSSSSSSSTPASSSTPPPPSTIAFSASGGPPPSLEQIDALSRDPISLAAVVAALDSELPALSRALVHERDEWLSWSLARSRAVCGADTVVGVLGAGHVRGVAWRLAQGDRCRPRFAELAGVGGSGIGGEGGGEGGKRRLSRKERAVRRIAIEFGIAVALGVAWEAWKRFG